MKQIEEYINSLEKKELINEYDSVLLTGGSMNAGFDINPWCKPSTNPGCQINNVSNCGGSNNTATCTKPTVSSSCLNRDINCSY